MELRVKVTKFLVKISKSKFLVMTEKNIFVYKLFFLSLNIPDLSFLWKNCNPPEKNHPSFPAFPATPSKYCDPVKPLLFENLIGGPPPGEKGEVHTMLTPRWSCDQKVM